MLNRFKCIFLIHVVFVSLNANASVFSDIWDTLRSLLGINYSKTINNIVTPPPPPCHNSKREVSSPDETFADDAEEKEVSFTQKDDTDADNVRNNLITNFEKLGGDPIALKQAFCFYDKHRGQNFKAQGDPSRSNGIKIQNQRFITINDLNKSFFDSRMYILDLETGKVKTYFSAHGSGGRKGVAESDQYAREFSNEDGSYATPRGFFITGSRINGSSDPQKRWKFSMKMHGLQAGINDRSYSRAVVMHSFPYISSHVATSDDESPRLKDDLHMYPLSKGCTMINEEVANDVIDTIKAPNNKSGGSLYYNYTPTEKAYGESYCGEEGLLKK